MKQREFLPIGTRVKVRRITGEEAVGFVLRGPLDYLTKIGEFYIIGQEEPIQGEDVLHYSGRGRKSKARLEYENRFREIGTYEREKITVC